MKSTGKNVKSVMIKDYITSHGYFTIHNINRGMVKSIARKFIKHYKCLLDKHNVSKVHCCKIDRDIYRCYLCI